MDKSGLQPGGSSAVQHASPKGGSSLVGNQTHVYGRLQCKGRGAAQGELALFTLPHQNGKGLFTWVRKNTLGVGKQLVL